MMPIMDRSRLRPALRWALGSGRLTRRGAGDIDLVPPPSKRRYYTTDAPAPGRRGSGLGATKNRGCCTAAQAAFDKVGLTILQFRLNALSSTTSNWLNVGRARCARPWRIE